MKVTGRQQPPENDAYVAYVFTYGWRITRMRRSPTAHWAQCSGRRTAAYMSAQGMQTSTSTSTVTHL